MRIISATHCPQRSSEGDIIRLGYGWSVPTNGSVGTLTFSHRYPGLVQDMLDRERFDVIHFHEPFVPFLSLVILRHSKAVNIATFHAAILAGDCKNPTVAPSVRSNLTTILGRTAAWRGGEASWDEVMSAGEELRADLSGLRS